MESKMKVVAPGGEGRPKAEFTPPEFKALTGEAGFISESQLLERIPISRRSLGNWKKRQLIPFIRLPGTRRVLYSWPSVSDALRRMERGGAAP